MYQLLIFSLLLIGVSAISKEQCVELERLPAGVPKRFVDDLLNEYRQISSTSRFVAKTDHEVIIFACRMYDVDPIPESTIFDSFKIMVGILIFCAVFELIRKCDLHYGINY